MTEPRPKQLLAVADGDELVRRIAYRDGDTIVVTDGIVLNRQWMTRRMEELDAEIAEFDQALKGLEEARANARKWTPRGATRK